MITKLMQRAACRVQRSSSDARNFRQFLYDQQQAARAVRAVRAACIEWNCKQFFFVLSANRKHLQISFEWFIVSIWVCVCVFVGVSTLTRVTCMCACTWNIHMYVCIFSRLLRNMSSQLNGLTFTNIVCTFLLNIVSVVKLQFKPIMKPFLVFFS